MTKASKNKKYNRWWTTIDGTRVIKNYPLDVDPNTVEHNVHYWQRGHGPHSPQRRAQLTAILSRFASLPKTPQHRAAMSRAATGVPKSDDHRAAMRAAHAQRIARVRVLQSEQPHLSYAEACKLEAQRTRELKRELKRKIK